MTQIKKGTLVLCSVCMTRKTPKGITEYYNGELFLGVVEDPGDDYFNIITVNLGPLGKYRASRIELLPVVQTDGSSEIVDAIGSIEGHTKRMQKALGGFIASLVDKH